MSLLCVCEIFGQGRARIARELLFAIDALCAATVAQWPWLGNAVVLERASR